MHTTLSRVVQTLNPGLFLIGAGIGVAVTLSAPARAEVRLERTPDGGMQPQAIVDSSGTTHLIYFKGDPKAGDIFYVRRKAGETNWSPALIVNSDRGSAIAMGTIRGAQLALGRNGSVHVAWNGAASKPPAGAPMLYSRLTGGATAFDKQRNLMTRTKHLDGGGSVAADDAGNVYVVFHAQPLEGKGDEANRAIYVARSNDDGGTFSIEASTASEPTGTCSCCGLKAYAGEKGSLLISYRTAQNKVNRDMALLRSTDGGATFSLLSLGRWQGATCPMSSTSLFTDSTRIRAAWEIGSQVYLGDLSKDAKGELRSVTPPGTGKRKHPHIAMNRSGETLLVWTEGTGWNKGGSLGWQIFDASLQPKGAEGSRGNRSGVPVWSFATAVSQVDGTFVILF